MSNSAFLKVYLGLVFLCAPSSAQESTKGETSGKDFSTESVVIEQSKSNVVFQNDGTFVNEQHVRVRIQSDAGVRQYGVLSFPYQASNGTVEVRDVRVIKPNETAIITDLSSIQDITSEMSRQAPMYSDLREKHVPVKGLEPGDTLEYSVRFVVNKPLIPGQFWLGAYFVKNLVTLEEQLEINVPRLRAIKLKSQTVQPTMQVEGPRRIYIWKRSNLESQSLEKQRENLSYDAMRGLLPAPDVLISSFRSWEEVGRWYENLQREKIRPSPDVKAKAEELTKGLADDDAKVRAIYNYVSLRYRYISISLGVGRYQPHAAAEILANQYGDCKDKHTLLAALLSAVGIHAYPALVATRVAVEVDVPSPGQFDHVISVVAKGSSLSWMDTTPEVTPMEYLVPNLRGKPALVIMPDKVGFQTTPADPQVANKDTDTVTAKIDADGTLQAHVDGWDHGDSELYFRYLFRQTPQSQWNDLGQRMFYGGRTGGTVTGVRISPPEKTEEPFVIAYDYSLKDFTGGDKHRFAIPLPAWGIPAIKDEDLQRTTPLWIGYVGEMELQSRIELPKGWFARLPPPIDLKESFAEFQGGSEEHDGTLITKRRFLLKASAVTPEQLERYRAFQKAVSDDYNSYILLQASANLHSMRPAMTPTQGIAFAVEMLRPAFTELPGSSSAQALQVEQDARKAMRAKDSTSAITALKQAVSLDPTFSRAWTELGAEYYWGARDVNSSLPAFQKAVEANPKEVIPYKILAFMYVGTGKQDAAIATWQKLRDIAPEDHDLALNLGELYMTRKRYPEAASLYESAIKTNPSDAFVLLRLGMARLRNHNVELGINALQKAVEIDSGAEMLNVVAYEMAEAGTNLPDALAYSQRSVSDAEERSQKMNADKLQKADLQTTLAISAYWDTLGWIYFKMGDLANAESYLNSAWQLGQDGVSGDHLAQVYEKERKLPAALHMYSLALEANPQMEETRSRIKQLAQVSPPRNTISAQEELSRMRTLKMPTITAETASADFDIVLGANGKAEKAIFLRGSELLRKAGESLEKLQFDEPIPPKSVARLLRRGNLSCAANSCSLALYPPRVAVAQTSN